MAFFSLLLLRNFSSKNPNFNSQISSFIRKTQPLLFFNGGNSNPFSTSPQPNLADPKTNLSARMSFVFDQIDAIEKERNDKDEALQRIRAWRETKKKKNEETEEGSKLGFQQPNSGLNNIVEGKKVKKEVELVHPWPEWIELMERLVQQNYFDQRRNDEDKMVEDLDIDVSGFSAEEEGFDFTKDWNSVKTACLNFGRDRFDIMRSLSRQDIQILVGHGCPSTDRKAVFSSKLLRKYVHLDEGDVCSSCNLRSSCDRAYLLTLKEDEARAIDIMRILLTYGFDPVNQSVENRSLLKMKSVKTVVRKLLHEVVKLSAVPIDPNLPPPVIKKRPPKVKQPPPTPKRRVGRDDIEMKKGDWHCPKCEFMNFAKNNVCLQCDAKRPKRQLLPGEWECPGCNFLNYRRNMACFHCDHSRPNDEFMENQVKSREPNPKTKLERVANMPEISNAWNFDFDDNESDGADVAAFEYADPPRVPQDSLGEGHTQEGNLRGFGDDSLETRRIPMANGRGRYANLDQGRPGTGFDDFDDEEEDDVDSYELESPNNNAVKGTSSRNFSEVEEYSEPDDFDAPDRHSHAPRGTIMSGSKRGKQFSVSEDDGKDLDSDEGLSAYSNWKSSHIGDSRNNARGRGASVRSRTFDLDNELEADIVSDDDTHQGFGSTHRGRTKFSSNRKDHHLGRQGSDSEDGLLFGSESDDERLPYSRNKTRGTREGPGRRGNSFRDHTHSETARDGGLRFNGRTSDRRDSFDNGDRGRSFRGSRMGNRGSTDYGYSEGRASGRRINDDRGRQDGHFGSNGRMNDRRNSFGDSDRGRSFRGSHMKSRGPTEDGDGGGRMNSRRVNTRDMGRDGRGDRFGFQQHGRSNSFKDRPERGFSDDRPRRRIIER